MKFVLDMNLSPQWSLFLSNQGIQAIHWSEIGRGDENDEVIMDWARSNDFIIFTHDLDFGTLLAYTHANGPSVIQLRCQNIMPEGIGYRFIKIVKEYEALLEKGTLITIDEEKNRIRILPIK